MAIFFSIPTSVDECGVVVSSYHLVGYSTVKAKIDCICIFQMDIYNIYIYIYIYIYICIYIYVYIYMCK